MKRLACLIMLLCCSLVYGLVTTSALINKELDTQQNLQLDTTLPDAMQQIGTQTGVRLEADPAVWELLPWGEQTSIKANIKNRTLRQGLAAITQKLALEFSLGDESVQLHPIPALKRLGRRATVDELEVLDLMTANAINLPSERPTFGQIVSAVNDRLAALKSSFVVDNQAADTATDQKIAVPRNATIAEALEAAVQQADAAWYPWGKRIVIIGKEEQVRNQLTKTLSARYNNVDVGQVLLELFQRAGVEFSVDPGAYQKVPEKYRSVSLLLDNASVQQGLDSISGYTGLAFDISDKGVHVSYAGASPAPAPAAGK